MKRTVFALVVGLAGAAVLLGLGTWQVQRLQWKAEILAGIEERIAEAPVTLPGAPDAGRDLFLPVRVAGQYSGDPLRVLVSVKVYGAGHRLISALVTEDGRRILVDRGYLRLQQAAATPEGRVVLAGNLHWPEDADGFTPRPEGDLWFARDVEAMAAALGTEPVLVILREALPPEAAVRPLPVDTSGIPNDHLEYAITWYALAIVWLVMTAYWLWRNRTRPTGTGDP